MQNSKSNHSNPETQDVYAFIISTEDTNWKKATRFINLLLKFGKLVYWAIEPFTAKTNQHDGDHLFEAGSFIVPLKASTLGYREYSSLAKFFPEDTIIREAEAHDVKFHIISHTFDAKILVLRRTRVALFADGGSPYPFVDILGELGFQNNFVTSADIRADILKHFHILVIPGGGVEGPPRQSMALGEEGRQKVKAFLKKGGALWGSCAGSWNMINVPEAIVERWVNAFPGVASFKSMNVVNAEYWSNGMPGIGLVQVRNINPRHPVMLGLPEEFEVTWHLGPFIDVTPGIVMEASDAIPVVQCNKLTQQWTAAEYMRNQSKQTLPGALEDTYAYKGTQEGKYGIVVGYYGLGRTLAAGCHPEFGLDWLLEKWGIPARIFTNFILWAGSSGPYTTSLVVSAGSKTHAPTERGGHYGIPITFPPTYGVNVVQKRIPNIRKKLAQLGTKSISPLPLWLTEEKAEASFGMTAKEKWPLILARMNELSTEIEEISHDMTKTLQKLNETYQTLQNLHYELNSIQIRDISIENAQSTINESQNYLLEQIRDFNGDINFKRPPEWHQDYGWIGIIPLLDACNHALDIAIRNFEIPDPSYQESPYVAIWDFYLGGLYDLLNALILIKNRINLSKDVLCIASLIQEYIKKIYSLK
jgi:hypothetical protein